MRNNERLRLKELKELDILDTLPEKEFDDITQLAAAICDMPIALVSLIDDKRQWFKSKVGLDVNETPRSQAFCNHAIQKPDESFIVEDPLQDERFRDNPLVTGDPNIRFYAGYPIKTDKGQALGTLCVIDNQQRKLSPEQNRALQVLADKTSELLNMRKQVSTQKREVERSAKRLKKLTDQAPGAFYQFEIDPLGAMSFSFVSDGISRIHPELSPEILYEDVEKGFSVIHSLDIQRVRESIAYSYKTLENWEVDYRVLMEDGHVRWHSARARPEKLEDGTVIWYGTFQDVTEQKSYEEDLRQISFSISHVMRRPTASLLGLIQIMEEEVTNGKEIKQYLKHLRTVSEEMDDYLRQLNDFYERKKNGSPESVKDEFFNEKRT